MIDEPPPIAMARSIALLFQTVAKKMDHGSAILCTFHLSFTALCDVLGADPLAVAKRIEELALVSDRCVPGMRGGKVQ